MEDNHLKILAIDDNQDNLTTLQAVLRDVLPQSTLVTALNGQKGFELAQIEEPDVILLDIVMPGMDGFAVCKKIKADENLRFIPVVFLTALKTGHESRVEALEVGAEGFLAKPLDEIELVAQIRAMVKIKAANQLQRREKEQLAALVDERTSELKKELAERVKIEEKLQESEGRFRSIVETANDAIITVNSQGDVIAWNKGAQEMFGYTFEETKDQSLILIIPERYRKDHKNSFTRVASGGTQNIIGKVVEMDGLKKDGSEFPIELSLATWESGNDVFFTAIIRDITEWVKAGNTVKLLLEQQLAVNHLALKLGETNDLYKIYDTIYTHIKMLVDVWVFVVSIYDRGKEQIQADYAVHKGTLLDVGEFPPIPLAKPGQGTQSRVIHTGEPFYASDHREAIESSQTEYIIKEDDNISQGPPPKESADYAKSSIYLPMKTDGKVIGVMRLQSIKKDAYTPEDIALMTGMANVAAVSMQNARLFLEASRRLEKLDALREIDQAITGSLDLKLTLEILLGHLLTQLKVDATVVRKFEKGLQTLTYSQGLGLRTTALQHTDLSLGQGHAGEVALQRRRIFIPDLNQDETGIIEKSLFEEEGFVMYYGFPLIAKGNLVGVLEVFHRSKLDPDAEWRDYLQTLVRQAAIAIDNISLNDDLRRSNMELISAYDATIEGWAQALEMRDMETEGHSRRVVNITMDLAQRLGISNEDLSHIRRGALLHDIGKMGVPDAILQKPGKLTEEERGIMRLHPVYAHDWLSTIEYLRPALDIPHYHHEKWNGTGYPRGLKGEQIPIAARIFAIVDVWDALCSDRPYRKAWSKKKTLAYIREESGKHFDPQVVEVFLENVEQISIE